MKHPKSMFHLSGVHCNPKPQQKPLLSLEEYLEPPTTIYPQLIAIRTLLKAPRGVLVAPIVSFLVALNFRPSSILSGVVLFYVWALYLNPKP